MTRMGTKTLLDKTSPHPRHVIPAAAKRRAGTSGDFAAQGLGLGFAIWDDMVEHLFPTIAATRRVLPHAAMCPEGADDVHGAARNAVHWPMGLSRSVKTTYSGLNI